MTTRCLMFRGKEVCEILPTDCFMSDYEEIRFDGKLTARIWAFCHEIAKAQGQYDILPSQELEDLTDSLQEMLDDMMEMAEKVGAQRVIDSLLESAGDGFSVAEL